MPNTLTSRWARNLVTDPLRANAAGQLRRSRAWARLKADRGMTCGMSFLTSISLPNPDPEDAA